jgi:hypothetical protein
MSDRPQKITFAEIREMGVRGLLVYCADYCCSHSIAISGDAWPDDARLSEIEERFTCRVCGKRRCRFAPGFQLEQAVECHDGVSVGNLNRRPALIPSRFSCPLRPGR